MSLPRITKFKVPRHHLLKSDDVQALIVRLWVGGNKQKEIAKAFGFAKAPQINIIISQFIVKYLPSDCAVARGPGRYYPYLYGEDRKTMAMCALATRATLEIKEIGAGGSATNNVLPFKASRFRVPSL